MKGMQHRIRACGAGITAVRSWTALVFCSVILLPGAVAAQTVDASEYQVKAAYLYNFAKFVEWPATSFDGSGGELQICLLGDDPFGPDLRRLIEGKTVGGHRLAMIAVRDVQQARRCQILFVSASEKNGVGQIIRAMTGASVLTVGDISGFASAGGMINFTLEENRVRFEINPKAAERVHLQLSARLLNVARLVQERGGN
jgi:YfiR/HmsC-like